MIVLECDKIFLFSGQKKRPHRKKRIQDIRGPELDKISVFEDTFDIKLKQMPIRTSSDFLFLSSK
jgi:hypothetical protein